MADTRTRSLGETILDLGIKYSNFVNGRLLTAFDLVADRQANRQRQSQLGVAIGEGIIRGLEVTLVADGSDGKPPVVSVASGLALARSGQVVSLPLDVSVALAKTTTTTISAGLFADCSQSVGAPSGGEGVYLLVMCPGSGYADKVPIRDLTDVDTVTGCGSRYVVEGVQFRLETLAIDSLTALSQNTRSALDALMRQTDPESLAKLRNWLAHVCFGTEELAAAVADPFQLTSPRPPYHSPFARYGALDALRAGGQLGDCDVPLALIFWPTSGVQFVDLWSVRRALVQPLIVDPWPLQAGQRRPAEAVATFLQFQNQLQDMLLEESSLSSVSATSRFAYLPAAGYLPVGAGQFTRDSFFRNLTIDRVAADEAFLRLILHESLYVEPIDLSNPPRILVYEASAHPGYLVFAREQAEAVTAPPGGTGPSGPTTGTLEIHLRVENVARLKEVFEKLTGKTLGSASGELVVDKDFLKITVRNHDTHQTYPVRYVAAPSFTGRFKGEQIGFRAGEAVFVAANLPPGRYDVEVRVTGFQRVQQQRSVSAGQRVTVVCKLVPEKRDTGQPPLRPSHLGSATWLKNRWFQDAQLIERYVQWPWPPVDWEHVPPQPDPVPDEFLTWAQEWASYLGSVNPEAPVDPGGVSVYLDPSYTPGAAVANPYAYLVFGEGGAYAPLVLTTPDRSLATEVTPARASLAGLDVESNLRLREYGLDRIDVVAAAWQGLVADALAVSPETASSIVGEAASKVDNLQGTLQVFSGLDSAMVNALTANKIDSPVALANADAQTVLSVLHGAGITSVTPAFAQRLVDQARSAVPANEWSLASSVLGLNEQQIASLRVSGITTLGQLQGRAAADVRGTAAVLDVSPQALTNLVSNVSIKTSAQVQIERRGAAPSTRVLGVNADVANRLARLGVTSVADLARANADEIAAAFGGDSARARAVISAASTMIRR